MEPPKQVDYNPMSKLQHGSFSVFVLVNQIVVIESKCIGDESFGTVLSNCNQPIAAPVTPFNSPVHRSTERIMQQPKQVELNSSVVNAVQRL